MPTLDEACRTLRVSRHTLRKWLKRLEIEPTQHPRDFRYWMLTPEQVEAISSARAEMPGQQIPQIARVRSPEPNLTAQGGRADTFPIPTASKRAETSLPDGMMSKQDAAKSHGMFSALTTIRRWCDEGKIETHAGVYGGEHGRRPVVNPITVRGLAQLYALASRRSDFTRCPECPHTAETPEADSGRE